MNTKKTLYAITALAAAGLFSLSVPAFAATDTNTNASQPAIRHGRFNVQMGQIPGVFGTVSAVDGNTITVTGKQGLNSTTATVYTVDASNAKVTKNNVAGTVADIKQGDTVSVRGTVSGNNVVATTIRDGAMPGRGIGQGGNGRFGIFGTVASVNSSTITVNAKQGFGSTTATTYTVDASNAKVTKDNAAATVADIKQDDTVFVQGTLSGTTVTATAIRDGKMAQNNTAVQGNGQPIVAGTVSSIGDKTLTITNKSNQQYTVDAASAKVTQGNNTIDFSNIKTGDSVIVQGTFNGNSVSASTIIDQTRPASASATSSGSAGIAQKPQFGFLGSIGQFFMHLFGFK